MLLHEPQAESWKPGVPDKHALRNPRVLIVGLLVIEIVMAFVLFPRIDHQHIETTDFLNFYAAASIVRNGHGPTLYTPETQESALQERLGRRATEFFLHPSFEAVAFVPLTYLKIEHAFVVWTLFNVALLGLLPLVFSAYLPWVAHRPYVGLLVFLFPPVFSAITLGQDSIVVLFIVSLVYLLFEKKRDAAAGLLLSLATIKFQYVVIVALLLIASRKFRFMAGFVAGCSVLIAVSILVTGPVGFLQYFRFVHQFDLHNGYGNIHPERLMNLRGFLSGLGWTSHSRFYGAIGSIALLLFGLVYSNLSYRRKNLSLALALFPAIALSAAPYDYVQDASILLPGVFLALEAVRNGQIKGLSARLVQMSCILLFLLPAILFIQAGREIWNSHIYLMFPVVLLFIVALAFEPFSQAGLSREQ